MFSLIRRYVRRTHNEYQNDTMSGCPPLAHRVISLPAKFGRYSGKSGHDAGSGTPFQNENSRETAKRKTPTQSNN
jgi:hypothetical protein